MYDSVGIFVIIPFGYYLIKHLQLYTDMIKIKNNKFGQRMSRLDVPCPVGDDGLFFFLPGCGIQYCTNVTDM